MDSPSNNPTDPSDRTRGEDEAFCRNCGEVIDARASFCPECGADQRSSSTTSSIDSALDDLFRGGNPFVAAVLSALFPGIGQIYNRELEKGVVIMILSLLAVASALVLVGFVIYPIIWIYAIYDAYKVAERQSETTSEPSPSP